MSGRGEILSKEGTTQDDPLGMVMFALAIVPLILKLMEVCQTVYQVWFAVDATAAAFADGYNSGGMHCQPSGPTLATLQMQPKPYLL